MKILKHLRSDWFRYGFETLAVVVGILIAFALDNWNEDRKEDILEIQYLNGMLSDLQYDTAYYKRRISESEWIVENHVEAIRQMYKIQRSLEDVRDLLNITGWSSEQLTTRNSTYVELTNSGSMSLINNLDLKDQIIDYYRENGQAAAHFREYNEFTSRHAVGVNNVIKNYDKIHGYNADIYLNHIEIPDSDWVFINDPSSEKFQSLENLIDIYRSKHLSFLISLRSLQDLSIHLVDSIQKELDLRE